MTSDVVDVEDDEDSEDEEEDDDQMMPGLDARRAKFKGRMYDMDDGVDYEDDSDDDEEEDNGDETASKTKNGRRGMRFAVRKRLQPSIDLSL